MTVGELKKALANAPDHFNVMLAGHEWGAALQPLRIAFKTQQNLLLGSRGSSGHSLVGKVVALSAE